MEDDERSANKLEVDMKVAAVMASLILCFLLKAAGQSVTLLPSQVLELTNWKLTLPIGTQGSPTEILQPVLASFVDLNYFYVNATGNGAIFTAPCGGVTTSGSGYPRSELREMANNGTTLASWSTTSGTHTMEITEAITHLPVAKPQVVAGQIHGASDDVLVCRLEGSDLFFDENGVHGPDMTTSYQLGTVFTVKFVAQNDGIACYYNGQYVFTYQVHASGCYFKAGCYTQSNTSKGDLPTAYGQVVIYGLLVNAPTGAQADLATKCSAPDSLVAGLDFTYLVVITNQGPSVASNIVVSDTLPAAATFVSATGGGVNRSGVVVWPTIPTLPDGGSTNFTVVVSAPNAGALTNFVTTTASTFDPVASNDTVRVVSSIGAQADVAVFSAGPSTAPPGSNLSYTITVTNLGPAAATNVTAADLLPVNAIFVSASGGGSPSGGTVNWPAISSLASGTAANFTLTITTPASGSITNRATAASTTPDPNSGNNNGASASSQTITAIIVTNLQTVTANFSVDPTSGQVPLTVQFTDQSTGPIVSWNWDFGDGNISTSQNPIHIYNSAGSFAARLTVAGSSGQTSGTVRTINVTNIASAMFDILAGTVYLNPQTGLFEQSVSVTNTGSGLAAAVRLHVDGLRSGVQLYNASGTDAGRPYAQYNLPLEPDQVVTFLLEFYVPDRSSFGDTLTVETATPASAQLFSGGFAINRAFMDTNSPGSPRVVIEFNTVPGGTYTVIYSDDGMVTWNAATPSITASSTVTQWYDNGPPDTSSRPVSVGGRIYHVITGPVTP